MNWQHPIFTLLFLLAVGSSFSCKKKEPKSNQEAHAADPDFGYNLYQEDAKIHLPDELEEISGIAYLKEGVLAGIQDEKGKLYFISLPEGDILDDEKFAKDGDFEDLALIDEQTAWVVRSDGKLFEIRDYRLKDLEAKDYKTPLSSKNDVEGLCYDAANHRLLLALKGKAGIDEDPDGEKRAIFAFDLAQKKLSESPVFMVNVDQIEEKADENLHFQPSGIAIHPLTQEYYIISSVGKLMVILDKKGKFVKAKKLKVNKGFKQPEGICFAPDGTLFISNEGDGGKANILQFNYRKP